MGGALTARVREQALTGGSDRLPEQTLHRLQGERVVVVKARSYERAGLAGREAVLGPGGADMVPCGSLRERLRTDVRGATRVVAVRPVLLRVGLVLRRGTAMTDGGDRGRHDDPLDAGGQARLDHAQGALAGRDYQLVGILGLLGREWRWD